MLSDVFVDRYENLALWTVWSPSDQKLLTQCTQIVKEDLFPVRKAKDGKDMNESEWALATKLLCRELGVQSLSPTHYQTPNGASWKYSARQQALNFLAKQPADPRNVDKFIKDRLSFVELMFRRAHENALQNEKGSPFLRQLSQQETNALAIAAEEINVRFARAGAPLNYHNGFIQVSRDSVVAREVERPFWSLVDNPRWVNVDLEMKEAIDRRDSGQSDAAFYAGKALESTVKVIAHERNWTTGKEKGGADHASNLFSATGDRFLNEWQLQSIKYIFSRLRNPFGHGAGVGEAPALSTEEIDWAISMCMTWISLLVKRHERSHCAD